jgi:exopolyphosphatase/guanosine-5'-triphosphate,3'-diphosphate pyrophosphatase
MSVGQRSAIIDIGSNSVRLVVYGGPPRAPFTLFNEKLLAGLGKGLLDGGRLADGSMKSALGALTRFRRLVEMMGVKDVQVVATAAVREASNGAEFLDHVARIGFSPRILSGEEEAIGAGYGVLSSNPEADGVVGDLGGGSLELVRIRKGQVLDKVSLPLGSLRLAAIRAKGPSALNQTLKAMLRGQGWISEAAERPFYLVGGSWRTLARLHIHKCGYPLPILANYEMSAQTAAQLVRMTSKIDKSIIKTVPTLSASRVPALNDAAALLASVVRQLKPSKLVTCANGLREGLLYARLDDATRALDPLLEDARAEGDRQGRFDQHGRLIHRWIKPLFDGEGPEYARLRHAACLLADIAWQANPEFRAERGVQTALQGNWTGASHRDRAMLAATLHASFGGGDEVPDILASLATRDELVLAQSWGLAIRLAQRLSGGTEDPLENSRLSLTPGVVRLVVSPCQADLVSDQVNRRLKVLATVMGRKPEITIDAIRDD